MDGTLLPVLSVALGIGLAAATGLRVFLPLLVAGIAAHVGHLTLSEHFQWLGSTTALITLGTAATFEVLAYYIPGVDHALDVIASPAAVAAGIVASAAVMTDVPPAILWPVAIIAGGGAAGLTKGSAALLRAKSGLVTGGLANPIVSTVETMGATSIAVLAVMVPLLCLAAVIALLAWAAGKTRRRLKNRTTT
jgi:hypothetical protein